MAEDRGVALGTTAAAQAPTKIQTHHTGRTGASRQKFPGKLPETSVFEKGSPRGCRSGRVLHFGWPHRATAGQTPTRTKVATLTSLALVDAGSSSCVRGGPG